MNPRSNESTARRGKDVPRVALTIAEGAQTLVMGELRVIHAGPRTTLVRVSELERWCERHEALDPPGRQALG